MRASWKISHVDWACDTRGVLTGEDATDTVVEFDSGSGTWSPTAGWGGWGEP